MAFDNVTLFGLNVDTDRLARRFRRAPEPEPEPATTRRGGRLARFLVASLVAAGAIALWRRRAARADAMASDDGESVEIAA